MVLNPNGTEPTFLKFDSLSPGAGFIPIINSNVLGSVPFRVQFHAYRKLHDIFLEKFFIFYHNNKLIATIRQKS